MVRSGELHSQAINDERRNCCVAHFFGYNLILESQNWLFVREPEHFKGIENILIV